MPWNSIPYGRDVAMQYLYFFIFDKKNKIINNTRRSAAPTTRNAGVMKLADMQRLERCECKLVRVQIPPPAQKHLRHCEEPRAQTRATKQSPFKIIVILIRKALYARKGILYLHYD